MAYDRRKINRLIANSEGIVIQASITYESDIPTGEFEDYGGEEIVTTLVTRVRVEQDYIRNGPTIHREHFSDIIADKDSIIGQDIDSVEQGLELSRRQTTIAVT